MDVKFLSLREVSTWIEGVQKQDSENICA